INVLILFLFSSRRRHTRWPRDWSSDVCSSDLFLTSDIPKIGFSLKYEHRFIKKKLGIDVNNWVHDGMIAAHILDNRRGVSGLERSEERRVGKEWKSGWWRSD